MEDIEYNNNQVLNDIVNADVRHEEQNFSLINETVPDLDDLLAEV